MKITTPAGALARALAFVSHAAARPATTQPILASALFEADKESGVLAIGATDTDLTARLFSSAPEIKEGGRAALPCRLLHDIVKALDAEATVHLGASDKQAALATQDGKNTYSLRLMAAENFPELANFPDEDGSSFTLEAAKLAEAIASVAPTASSTDDSRPVLTGVMLAFGSDDATLVATDSYR
ncbi:MAG: DNA polymerase III subunit beta, partial [Rubrobacteraceae bacterium]